MELSSEAVVGAVTILGGAVVLLNRVGWLRIGSNNNGKKGDGKCPDTSCQEKVVECHDTMISMKSSIDSLSDTQRLLLENYTGVKEDIAFIRGKLEGGQ